MIFDSDGKPLQVKGVYTFNIGGVEEVKVLGYSTQECFKDHCGIDICGRYGLYILLQLIKGSRVHGSRNLWVFHWVGQNLTTGWHLIHHPTTSWFDIWCPTSFQP